MGRVGLLILAIGLAFAGLAWWAYAHQAAFAASAARAEGVVLELVRHRGSKSSTWRPRVRFEAEGVSHEFVDSAGSSPPAFAAGERVTVLYEPGHPEDAMVDSWVGRYLLCTILGGFATLGCLVGGVVLWTSRPRRPPPADVADWPTRDG